MSKEVRNFLFKATIELNENGKLLDLSKKLDVEVDWFNWSKGRVSERPITFEKENEKYQLLVKIDEIKKGWFKDKVIDYSFERFPGEEFIVFKPDYWNSSFLGVKQRYRYDTIEPTQKRSSGFILVTVLFGLIIILLTVWHKKKKRI